MSSKIKAMSRTIRTIKGNDFPDSSMCRNPQNDNNPKKSFVWRDENCYTKSNGGPGNKRGWNTFIPKWLYKKYKEKLLPEY